jgi:S1-C subfamily serine protease
MIRNRLFLGILGIVIFLLLVPGSISGVPGKGASDAEPPNEDFGNEESGSGEFQPEEDGPEVDSVVEIEVTSGDTAVQKAGGSGVIYALSAEKLCVVTAAHVLSNRDDGDGIVVRLPGGEAVVCQEETEAADADLAFLWLETSGLSEKTLERLCEADTDKESYDSLAAGDVVSAMGYRDGSLAVYDGKMTDSWIYVEDFAQYMMLAECEIYEGMSGGALCDAEGHLLGILCGGNEQGELVAVPWHVVQAKLMDAE